MTKIKITKALAVKAVRQAVREMGTEHTARCTYVMGGKPVCIVGKALVNAGLPVKTLAKIGNGTVRTAYENNPNDAPLPEVPLPDVVEITPRALDFLDVAQEVQDSGASWGEALRRGLAYNGL